jgi:ribosome-associated protein
MPVSIPQGEIRQEFSRSGGKGGQNVNKVESRVQLFWNLWNTRVLDDVAKARVAGKLASRMNDRGELMVVVDSERSQVQNRALGVAKLQELVRRALVVPKRRTATKPTRASKERRLESKSKRSLVKKDRGSNKNPTCIE